MNIIDIDKKTFELKEHIAQFETISFVTQYYYLLNTHLRTSNKLLEIKSPLRQIQYLLSLFLDTNPCGKVIFDPISGNAKKIDELLEEIEKGYRYNYFESIKETNMEKDEIEAHLMVSNQTFINYFVNGDLNFAEQEIERIKTTFKNFDIYIYMQTGLYVKDYLEFFELTDFIDHHKIEHFTKEISEIGLSKDVQGYAMDKTKRNDGTFETIFEATENAIYRLPIQVDMMRKMMSEEKINKLLEIFGCEREGNDSIRYYTNDCILIRKPIIWVNNEHIVMPCQKQIVHAIYDYLFDICKNYDKENRKVFEAKDNELEDKAFEIFNEFFDGEAKIYRNYYIDVDEKDLLVLYRNTAFIIECKANKYREPLRDPTKAFKRIKDDFEKCIQKGYDQAHPVMQLFRNAKEVNLRDERGKIMATVNTNKYRTYFSIVVTAERFGQIQCDLGLLLQLSEADNYPWSVYIDDLETFLLTLKRKNGFYGEFTSYLTLREKLNERLYCFDETELCSYFLMQKTDFIRDCNDINKIFVSSPTMHQIFDELYNTGLGFKNERNLRRKIDDNNELTIQLHKALNLKTPKSIKIFKKENRV